MIPPTQLTLTLTLIGGGPFEGVLRSKGFVHVEGIPGPHYWSHAGRCVQLSKMPGTQVPAGQGQELVFIGISMDGGAACAALDAALRPAALI